MRSDGKLLACTRRGEVWLISHPNAEDPAQITYKLFATGLHEALGLLVDGKVVYVVQRPELTKLVDRDGDDVADEYLTVCDKWGVSGDYHEFAFGPARDRQGNFFVTLNVGFGGGHQSKAPWRGWCVKITPKGELIPYAVGLRSPNGIAFSPEGDLFYCDNQGEWVATNKMHHVREGDYFGHTAGLRWVGQSPFAGKIPEKHASGMLYDGQPGKNGVAGMPPLTPPCIWFPYGSPEEDRRAEKVKAVQLSADRRTASLAVDGFRKGRVYELHLDGVKSADGDPVLHPEAYYTLNELP